MATEPLMCGRGGASNSWRKALPFIGTRVRKIWWLQKVQYLQRKYHCQWTLSCEARNLCRFFTVSAICCVHKNWFQPRVSEWFRREVLGDCISKSTLIPVQPPQYRQYALISDFLDRAHQSIREEAAWATMTGPALRSFPKNLTADVQYATDKCESLGPRASIDTSRNAIGTCKALFPHVTVLRRHFLPIVHFQCCMLLRGTLGGDFDTFAASGESTAQVLLWKTLSRPIGVRVCPVAQFNFFSTEFDPREWTKVVFWKEDSVRQPQLISPENEGGDETSSTSPPKFTFFGDLDVPFRPRPRGLFDQSRGPYPEPQDPPDGPDNPGFHQDYLQLLHLLVEKRQERWINRVNDRVRDHHYPNLTVFDDLDVPLGVWPLAPPAPPGPPPGWPLPSSPSGDRKSENRKYTA